MARPKSPVAAYCRRNLHLMMRLAFATYKTECLSVGFLQAGHFMVDRSPRLPFFLMRPSNTSSLDRLHGILIQESKYRCIIFLPLSLMLSCVQHRNTGGKADT